MKVNTSSERLWRTIRGLRSFTIHDLIAIAQCSEQEARVYISLLLAGGYLRVSETKQYDRKTYVYALAKDTGAKFPTKRTCLYDPNTGEFILPQRKA